MKELLDGIHERAILARREQDFVVGLLRHARTCIARGQHEQADAAVRDALRRLGEAYEC